MVEVNDRQVRRDMLGGDAVIVELGSGPNCVVAAFLAMTPKSEIVIASRRVRALRDPRTDSAKQSCSRVGIFFFSALLAARPLSNPAAAPAGGSGRRGRA